VAIQDLYNDFIDLYSYGQTGTNDIGGVEKTAVLKTANIPAYTTEIDEDTYYQYGKTTVQATHRIFCGLQPNIKSSDKIYVHGPHIWVDILFIDNAAGQDHHLEIAALAIEAPEALP